MSKEAMKLVDALTEYVIPDGFKYLGELRELLAEQPAPAAQQEIEEYDAGLLSAAGGGDVEWWWDYIRAELGCAYEHYQSQMTAPQAQRKPLTEPQKQALAENWFSEDWAITKAIGMMFDHERLLGIKENT